MKKRHKMKPKESEELARLFAQLMTDIQARQRNPCEWIAASRRGPCAVSCIPHVPIFYTRWPDGRRQSYFAGIARASDIWYPSATWICERLALH